MPECKQQSTQWVEPGGSEPKKAVSAGKVMTSAFWDAKGILLFHYLVKVKTNTGEYYFNFFDLLNVKIRKKNPSLKKKKTSFIRITHLLTKPPSLTRVTAMYATRTSPLTICDGTKNEFDKHKNNESETIEIKI